MTERRTYDAVVPGFKKRILAKSISGPGELERQNANLVGGDKTGGYMDLRQLLARIKITDQLVEVDAWCGYSGRFTHLKTGEPAKDRKVLHAAVMADGVNLGLTKMAETTDDPRITYGRLAWASDWHVRDDTYQGAIAEIVNFHHRLPFAGTWGEGRTSSSDGQRYQAGGHKDFTSQVNARYGREPGVRFYAHVSDQYAPFYSRVINTSVRDATHVLDGLLYHETDLDIEEHYVDTEGYTD